MNGTYIFNGQENGKPKYTKKDIKIYWTGDSWECTYEGLSLKAPVNSPIPPLSGYTYDQGSCNIQTSKSVTGLLLNLMEFKLYQKSS